MAVDARLEVGEVTEVIEVTGSPPVLQTETTEIGGSLTARTVSELPLGGQRRFTYLARVQPAILPAEPGARDALGGGFSAYGVRSNGQNNFLLNGVDNNVNVIDFINQTAYVIGEGEAGFRSNAVNAQRVYNGQYLNLDNNEFTGIDGKERCLQILEQGDEIVLPQAMQAPRHEIVHLVVALRHPREHIVNEPLLVGRRERYEPGAKFSTWLFTIAGNLAKSELRRRKRWRFFSLNWDEESETGIEVPDESHRPDTMAETAMTDEMIQDAIESLPAMKLAAAIDDTAANENTAFAQHIEPTANPSRGPNASLVYRYGPPVRSTALAASVQKFASSSSPSTASTTVGIWLMNQSATSTASVPLLQKKARDNPDNCASRAAASAWNGCAGWSSGWKVSP